ncbi:hypothetical protein ACFLU1_02955 [Chloroflexota bacterium]
MNKPTVVLNHVKFVETSKSAASSRLMPALRSVGQSVPTNCSVMEDVEAGITPAVIDEIITALTKPLTKEEQYPTKEVEKPQRITFKGNLQEVNQFFYKRGWTDGLPIIPPTEEAVAEMLTGTDLPPDHVVTRIIPRMGKATVEKIAVNAVMAGALPTYMPVLIATLQAIMEPRGNFANAEVSTYSFAPCCLVNGPIRKDLHINSGTGAMSPGDIANAAIGRAIGLLIKNIGGARKGIEDMGSHGNPLKYSLVIAENEEENPWEPLHVQEGLKKEDSAVTVFYVSSLIQVQPYGTSDDLILKSAAYNIPPLKRGLICFLLIPPRAKTLADKGWTKEDIAAFISEYARAPLSHHQEYLGAKFMRGEKMRLSNPLDNPNESMSILRDPRWIRVFVSGGLGDKTAMLMGSQGGGPTAWVTKKIELPANWDKLVEKYKGLVPTHLRY